MPSDGSLTLEQIDGEAWGEPPADASRLVKTGHELRRKPVSRLDAEDLRLLLGQRIGVEVLVPYALSLLETNPLAEGDYYPGDLLVTVLELPAEFWRRHAEPAARLARVAAIAGTLDLDAHHAPADVISAALKEYRARRG
ncbi:contact-dependent growth inhibition system immunity protein [Amycolatopsis sp. A133]|uniref:contact-dependent growth inhibition system immunity protein n=1 Tax=Amycolatopsis sp. A133 TaxID=3064472 RepID=UPI0027EFA3D4|nr:contact-dependent growth inhibition system immunity protein [Amycolatopsis sp. A133]MDQ7806660.1 contact-dependent growth inhibition system immunity protein [Amycolatopsis sp. A133]